MFEITAAAAVAIIAIVSLSLCILAAFGATEKAGRPALPQHLHWAFIAYDGRTPLPGGFDYQGAVALDVLGEDYAEALATCERLHPRTSSASGYELRNITEHIAGTCKN